MAAFYKSGEKKTRPGIYQRFVNSNIATVAGAETGIVAIPIQASWGAVGAVTVHENATSVKNTYGTEGTVDAAVALFEGGASKVYCVRVGASDATAKKATVTLKNASETAVLTIEAKYEGTRKLNVSVRSVSDTSKELVVYDGTTKVESFIFDSGEGVDEAGKIVSAVASSKYITATAQTADNKTVAVVTNVELTGGANPKVANEDYSKAFNALESYSFNYIALDTVSAAVQAILIEWLNRVYESGKLVCAVIGGTNKTATIEAMNNTAKAFDNKQVIYSGICGQDIEGKDVDGYRMAALVCGAIAGTPTDESIVHKTVPGIAAIKPFTNAEYEDAIKSGLLLASVSSNGTVWFDSGVNTLVNPSAEEDEGWKKIRRVATRFELMNRIDVATAPLIGKVNCDSNGIAIYIQYAQGVINEMIKEGKLHNGATVYEDPETPYAGDSAWFIIVGDDIDSLEKSYFKYQFRFSPNS